MNIRLSSKLMSDPYVIKYGTEVGLARAIGELYLAYVISYDYVMSNQPVPEKVIRRFVSDNFAEGCLCLIQGDYILIHNIEDQFRNCLRLKKIGTESAQRRKKERIVKSSAANRFENRFKTTKLSDLLLSRLVDLGLKSGEFIANPKALENRFSSVEELDEFLQMTITSPAIKDSQGLDKKRYTLAAIRKEIGIR